MPKERVDVLAYKQGLFETREQAKRGVMAGLVVNVINGERYDKPGEEKQAGPQPVFPAVDHHGPVYGRGPPLVYPAELIILFQRISPLHCLSPPS